MNTKLHQLSRQRGSMVLEIALVAAVLALVGFVAFRSLSAKQATKSSNVATEKSVPSTEPNGKVETAVNAVTEDAGLDDSLTAGFSQDAEDVLSADDEAAQMEGSINNASL